MQLYTVRGGTMLPRVEPILPSASGLMAVTKHPERYCYELKLDGWRCIAYVEGGRVKLTSKNKKPLGGFHEVRRELRRLPVQNVILDGELVCLNERGFPCFNDLMHRKEAHFYVFDLLYLNDHDLRLFPLSQRKDRLKKFFAGHEGIVKKVDSVPSTKSTQLITFVRENDLEGIVAKRTDAPYDAVFPDNWVKVLNSGYTQYQNRWKWFTERKK